MRIENSDSELGNQYAAQVQTMAENARRWRAENPNKEVLIGFDIPPGVLLIVPVSEALKKRWIRTNDAGLSLIKAMWPLGGNDEPTVTMLKFALGEPGKGMWLENHIPVRACPVCGYKMGASNCISGQNIAPNVGDLSLCFGCGEVLIFDAEMRLVRCTPKIFDGLDQGIKNLLARGQEEIRKFRKFHPIDGRNPC